MSVSDVLRPDGSDYDPFLLAEVGEDKTGATVTVLSALARLGLEPWTEARELTLLGRDAAHARLKAHLSTVRDVPTLDHASGSVATKLVALLPKRVSHRVSKLPETIKYTGPRIPIYWMLISLMGALILARIFYLAQAG